MITVLGWMFVVYLAVAIAFTALALWECKSSSHIRRIDRSVVSGVLWIGFGWPGLLLALLINGHNV